MKHRAVRVSLAPARGEMKEMNIQSVRQSPEISKLHLSEDQIKSISAELDGAGIDFFDLSDEELKNIIYRYVRRG